MGDKNRMNVQEAVDDLEKINRAIEGAREKLQATPSSEDLASFNALMKEMLDAVHAEVNANKETEYALCYRKNKQLQLAAQDICRALDALSRHIDTINTGKSEDFNNDNRVLFGQTFSNLVSSLRYRPSRDYLDKAYTRRMAAAIIPTVLLSLGITAVAITFMIPPLGVGIAVLLGVCIAVVLLIMSYGTVHESVYKRFKHTPTKEISDYFSKDSDFSAQFKDRLVTNHVGKDVLSFKLFRLIHYIWVKRKNDEHEQNLARKQEAVTKPYQAAVGGKSEAYDAVNKNRLDKIKAISDDLEKVGSQLTQIQGMMAAISRNIEDGAKDATVSLKKLKKADRHTGNRIINDKTTLEKFRALEINPDVYDRADLNRVAADLARKDYLEKLKTMSGLLSENLTLLESKKNELNDESQYVPAKVTKYQLEERTFDSVHARKAIQKLPDRFHQRMLSAESRGLVIGTTSHTLFSSSSKAIACQLYEKQEKLFPR